jgi:hypothetical protein
MRGFWCRIIAVFLLAVPLVLAWHAFELHMLWMMESNPARFTISSGPQSVIAAKKELLALGSISTLIEYMFFSIIPAIYLTAVELVAIPIRRYLLPDREEPKGAPTA